MTIFSSRDRDLLRSLTLFLLASTAVLVLSGCGIFSPDESDDSDKDQGGSDFKPTAVDLVPGPTGRENVIFNLELAYEEPNYEQYENLIHDLYVFRVDPAEVDIIGSAELNSDEDLESTRAMFRGEWGEEPILDAAGVPTGEMAPVPPVQSIRLDLIPVVGSNWEVMPDGDFEGSWRRIYEVDMTVTYSGDSRVDQIRGKQVFYVTPGTLRGETTGKLFWQLRGWEDQGIKS